ncbi:hypothetical protein [Streptomyces sp. NPDC002851]
MSPETPAAHPANSPQQLLEQWTGDLPYQLLLLEHVLVGEEFAYDYAPTSLNALETRLLQRYAADQDPYRRTEFTQSAAAYLGEVLLGIAGGSWAWNTRPFGDLPGQPVVRPDQELELSPIAPMLLIAYALRVRTGTAFADEAERLRQAVAGRQQADDGWEPVRAHLPYVPPAPPLPEHPALAAWLDERERALSAWAEDAFDGAWRWNFHPDTLDWLDAVVRRRFATVEEFDAAREEPFVQGACWYLGEVIRRNKGAVWQYVPFDPDTEPGTVGSRECAWTEVPFVDQPDKRVGGTALPLECLRELLPTADAAVAGAPQEPEARLRDVLFWFRASSYAHVGAVLERMGMVPPERVAEVIAHFADLAHEPLPPHEVPSALEEFGVAVSAHGDDVDFLEESYEHFLERASALTDGAVTITDVRLRMNDEKGDDEDEEFLEFARNGVVVTQPTEHMSDEYLDHLAISEMIGHVDPDPGDDPRRFYLASFVRLRDANFDSYFVFATPEQADVLEKELGLELRG